MDLGLKDKVVIVTGGAKGIGAAIVRECAAEGAVPVIVGRDAEAGKKVQSELQKNGSRCGLISVDLSTAESCEQSVAQTVKEFGRLDALVNNAGRNDKVGLEEGNPKEYVASLSRNLVHYYSMAHYSLPHLKRAWVDCECRLQDCCHWTGKHFWVRIVQGRNYGPHEGVGGRVAAIWNPCKHGDSGGSDDSFVSELARHVSESRAETEFDPLEDSAGETDDYF